MDTSLFLALIAGAGALGSITSGLIGWLESGEAFVGRKFASTVVRAIVSGIGLATAYSIDPNVNIILALFTVFLAGMGIDAAGNRIAGAISARKATTTTPATTTPT